MNPRRLALSVLKAVDETPQHLETILQQKLAPHLNADPRDRALAFNLIYEVLRNRLYLDHLLAAFCKKPLAELDAPVMHILRLGAAEIVLLRTPDYAAVHAAVELARKAGVARASGFINAALRALARGWQEVKLPDRENDPLNYLSVKYSHPVWLVEELCGRWGVAEAEAWLNADQKRPAPALRVNTLKTSKESLRALLAPAAGAAEDHFLSPETLILPQVKGPLSELSGFAEGLWQAQDPAASAVSRLLRLRPGLRVLDLCAGAGGKSGHLAALLENAGELVAVEPSPGRARALRENLARLGVTCARVLEEDGTRLPADLGQFDCILVDAPCSGLGTLGRRPDLRWRRSRGDVERLAGLQRALLAAGERLLGPGGAMLYVTCTVTLAENEKMVQGFVAETPGLRLEWDRRVASEAAALIGEDCFFRTFPHRHRCDAFFAARLVK